MSETKTKPEWQDWLDEPWEMIDGVVVYCLPNGCVPACLDGFASFSEVHGSSTPSRVDARNTKRVLACVNALSGIRNPAAVREVIEAARSIPEHAGAGEEDDIASVPGVRLIEALAKLDQEPEA